MGEVIGLVGKKCKIFYTDDLTGKVQPRIATVISEGVGLLIFENEYGIEGLPYGRIIRVVVDDGN